MSRGKDQGNARRNNGNKRNAVVALFAAPGGSQNRIVPNRRQLSVFELGSDAAAQADVRFGRLVGNTVGIKFINHAPRPFDCWPALFKRPLRTCLSALAHGRRLTGASNQHFGHVGGRKLNQIERPISQPLIQAGSRRSPHRSVWPPCKRDVTTPNRNLSAQDGEARPHSRQKKPGLGLA